MEHLHRVTRIIDAAHMEVLPSWNYNGKEGNIIHTTQHPCCTEKLEDQILLLEEPKEIISTEGQDILKCQLAILQIA